GARDGDVGRDERRHTAGEGEGGRAVIRQARGDGADEIGELRGLDGLEAGGEGVVDEERCGHGGWEPIAETRGPLRRTAILTPWGETMTQAKKARHNATIGPEQALALAEAKADAVRAPGGPTRVVVLGGGFAGVYTAKHLTALLGRRRDVEVELL